AQHCEKRDHKYSDNAAEAEFPHCHLTFLVMFGFLPLRTMGGGSFNMEATCCRRHGFQKTEHSASACPDTVARCTVSPPVARHAMAFGRIGVVRIEVLFWRQDEQIQAAALGRRLPTH